MKKVIFSLLFVFVFALVASPILAEESATRSTRSLPINPASIKEKIEKKLNIQGKDENKPVVQDGKLEKLEERLKKLDEAKKKVVERVRYALVAHWNVLSKAIERSESLLGKLQERINKAEAAGKDVTEAKKLMAEANERLTHAKVSLAKMNELKNNSITKDEFITLRDQMKGIKEDLQVIRKDAAKIISILKGFNSATSSGQNPQATFSATSQ